MPKTIPCWSCKGKGKVRIYPEHLQTGYHDIQCKTCNGGGVLSVYTQVEIKKLNQDCKNLIKVNKIQNGIMDSRDLEIKKLKEALEDIRGRLFHQDMLNESQISGIELIIKQALKDSSHV